MIKRRQAIGIRESQQNGVGHGQSRRSSSEAKSSRSNTFIMEGVWRKSLMVLALAMFAGE